MKKSVKRISIGVFCGLLIFMGVIWLLSKTLGNREATYAGKPLNYWCQQLNGRDFAASNHATQVLNTEIMPRLVDQMFHDTNDSALRTNIIGILNGLPYVQIDFMEASGRRGHAAQSLGMFGPAAKAAIPDLINAVKSKDSGVQSAAIQSLGKIHGSPDVVIPFLINYLTDDDLNDEAASALGEFGPLAKEAIPEIIPLLHAKDDDAQAAAATALKKIDPENYAKIIDLGEAATNTAVPTRVEKADDSGSK